MKRITALLLALAMVLCLAACGSSAASTAEPAAAASAASEAAASAEASAPAAAADAGYNLMSDGILSVGCEVGYPPFEDFADDGVTPIGVDVDIITEVANRLGLQVNIINTAWDGIFEGIDVNYDVVCSACTITPERQKTMSFSDPYISNYQAVVIPTGSSLQITSFNDLDGMAIALQKETTSDILMSDYKDTGTIDVNIVANEKVTSCFTQLTNGEVDAVVVDSTVADGYIASSPDLYTIAYLDEAEAEEFGIAMGLENDALRAAVNEALKSMKDDGTLEEILNYWFGA